MIIKQYTSEHSTNQRREGIQNISWNKQKRKHNILKLMGCSQSSSKMNVYSNTILTQETKISKNLTSFLNQLEEEQAITKVSRRIKEDQSRNK